MSQDVGAPKPSVPDEGFRKGGVGRNPEPSKPLPLVPNPGEGGRWHKIEDNGRLYCPNVAPFVGLTAAEYNQLLATLMEARGWFDGQRSKGRMWMNSPEDPLAEAQRMLAGKL